eukprot:CAMPEP_0169355608 /NCGR_PEP_ID=MMETSP1017-20121227/27068_1 /TAXON_ID=342587 /ORGANISM="Karlodinium micrum, Strain CCMP2283" /LENGTH=369 /DNA_ID=CAMNT_0009452277 /DNA_START=39 /DNA_END=1144 /DNA_ORIENTATION=-
MDSSPRTSISAKIASMSQELMQIHEQRQQDEQRMGFLENADTLRSDFYEIRSQKKDVVRRIVINAEAEIVFDSESKVKIDSACGLLDFDETDTKFSHVIPDTKDGRDYYRRLRGLQPLPKIPRDLPRLEREAKQRQLSSVVENEARELRRVIVANFQDIDQIERQSEMSEIAMRGDILSQTEAELELQVDKLKLTLLQLLKDKREEELKRQQDEVERVEARRKQEHARKQAAWLDRLSNRMHERVETQTWDVADCSSSITVDSSYDLQRNADQRVLSDTCARATHARNITEDTSASVDVDRVDIHSECYHEHASSKHDCVRSEASTCSDFEESPVVQLESMLLYSHSKGQSHCKFRCDFQDYRMLYQFS